MDTPGARIVAKILNKKGLHARASAKFKKSKINKKKFVFEDQYIFC